MTEAGLPEGNARSRSAAEGHSLTQTQPSSLDERRGGGGGHVQVEGEGFAAPIEDGDAGELEGAVFLQDQNLRGFGGVGRGSEEEGKRDADPGGPSRGIENIPVRLAAAFGARDRWRRGSWVRPGGGGAGRGK
jgi:hypothetical protein